MGQLVWVIAIVILLGLLQLVVYRYLSERIDGEPATGSLIVAEPAHAMVSRRGEDAEAMDVDRRPCPRCGTSNGAEYTFCRRCVGRLVV